MKNIEEGDVITIKHTLLWMTMSKLNRNIALTDTKIIKILVYLLSKNIELGDWK